MATGVCALLGIEAGEVADLVAEALGFALDFVAGVTFLVTLRQSSSLVWNQLQP
jgi:hypothetical protein